MFPIFQLYTTKVLDGDGTGRRERHPVSFAELAAAVPYEHNAFKIDLVRRTLLRALARIGDLS